MKKIGKNISGIMKYFGIFIPLILILSFSSMAQTKLQFTTGDNQSHNRSKAMNAVLRECFLRMGISLEIISMPSKRSLENANNGIEDGNFVRTDGITQTYTNLIKVPEKISENQIVAFSKNPNIRIDGWKSLLGYHVACVNGWKNCERELEYPKQKTIVKNEKLLFILLHKNRAEVGVFGFDTGKEVLQELNFPEIQALQPPIVTSDLFLYVHKKHRYLIKDIVKTLQLMKEDGTYSYLSSRTY